MSRNVSVSGTLCKKEDTWCLNTGERSIQIRSSFVIDSALENQKVSIAGKQENSVSFPDIADTFNAERIVSHTAIAERANAIFNSGKASSAADNWYLAEKELLGITVKGIYNVVGTITGPGHVGLTVKAFDSNLGEDDTLIADTLIAETTTDAQGNYSITYDLEKLDGKSAADMVIAVYRGSTRLQSSDIIFDAPQETTKDFILPEAIAPEFQRLADIIKPLLKNKIGLGTLEKKQVDFLNKKTGIDTRKLEWLSQSHSLAGKNETLATFYYGLLSQNLPVDPSAILSRGSESIGRSLQLAALAGHITPLKVTEIDHILNEELPKLRAEKLLNPASKGEQPSLGDLLLTLPRIHRLDLQSMRKVADLITQQGTDYAGLSKQLKEAGIAEGTIVHVERTLRLGDLSQQNTALMTHLQELTAADRDASLKALAAVRRDQWIDKAYAYGVPSHISVSPEVYAVQMEMEVEAMHPTATLSERIKAGELYIDHPGFDSLGSFLVQNPSFDIRSAAIVSRFKEAIFNGIADADQLTHLLQKVSRSMKLSATLDEAAALVNNDLDSALHIVAVGQERMKLRLSGKVASQRAEVLYANAKQTHDFGLALMSRVMPRFSPTQVAAMGGTTRIGKETIKEQLKEFTSLQEIFGSLDYCACNPDLSVLSPAAYFVDLLQFLNNAGNTTGTVVDPVALNELLERRPDLVDLQLTSENTRTELPYIDLVIEILENAVALASPLTVPLPMGTSGEYELNAKSLSSVITDVLQATSLETIGSNLKAEKALRQFQFDTCDAWTVTDRQRRWTLHNQQGAVYVLHPKKPRLKIGLTGKEINLKKSAEQLNFGELSPEIKTHIEKLIKKEPEKRYLSPSGYSVSTMIPNRQWKISFRLGVKVMAEDEGKSGSLTLETEGGTVFKRQYSSKAIIAAKAGLEKGNINGILSALFPDSDGMNIHADGPSVSIDLPGEIIIVIEPDQLSVNSLCYQTLGDSNDLKAAPRNQNPAAYTVPSFFCDTDNYKCLSNGTFPWSLPFNLPLETVRTFLERSKVTRRLLMESMRPEEYLNDTLWCYEMLGISSEDAELLTNFAVSPRIWALWGMPTGTSDHDRLTIPDLSAGTKVSGEPLTVLSRVSILMQQARLSFDDLQKILNTKFVAPSSLQMAVVDPDESDCCPSNLSLQQLQVNHLDRIHRFVRLWRKVGWSIEELDFAIYEFHDHKINTDLLLFLSHIKRLRDILGLSIKELISWWGFTGDRPLLYTPYALPGEPESQSLYEQIFLNPLLQSPPDPDFTLNANKKALQNFGIRLSSKASSISAALGITQQDFNTLLSWSGLVDALRPKSAEISSVLGITPDEFAVLLTKPNLVATLGGKTPEISAVLSISHEEFTALLSQAPLMDHLSIESLFYLYRTTSLIKALGLSVQEYLRLIALLNCNWPQSSSAFIKEIISFCKTVRFVQGSGFSAEELGYLLQHKVIPGSPLILEDNQANQTLKTVLSALQIQLRSLDKQVRDFIEDNQGGPTVLKLLTGKDAVGNDAASLVIGFAPLNTPLAVMNDLVLPLKGRNGSFVTWVSDDPSIIENDGKIKRPSAGNDAAVTITAKITNDDNSITVSRDFQLTVLKTLNAHEAVQADAAALVIGYAPGDSASGVACNLLLVNKGGNGSKIIWTSSDPSILRNDGKVKRPDATNDNACVTLTAKVTKGLASVSEQKVFKVTVLRQLDEEGAAQADATGLTIGYTHGDIPSEVTGNLLLATVGVNGATITWLSSNPDVIRNDGTVLRPGPTQDNVSVAMTATVVKGNKSITKVFLSHDLLNRDILDLNMLANVILDQEIRRKIVDASVNVLAGAFTLEVPSVQQLLVSDSARKANLYFQDVSGKRREGIEAFLDPQFLSSPLNSTFNSVTFPDLFAVLYRLHKASIILSRLKMKPAQLSWFAGPNTGMTGLNLNDLPVKETVGSRTPFNKWQQSVMLFLTRNRFRGMAALLDQYISAVSAQSNEDAAKVEARKILVIGLSLTATATDTAVLEAATVMEKTAEAVGLKTLEDYRDPLKLDHLLSILTVMKELGANLEQLRNLTKASDSLTVKEEILARTLVRSKYGAESWREILKPVSDQLRLRQREALVDFLLHREGLLDANELYEYYLIDPQMSPCMLTSRQVQATAAIQLFVQRCLLNLQDVTFNNDDRRCWEWMKNYRVWEANRKVFLYPENWLYPELRNDKTEIFKSFESGLAQGEPNFELAKEQLQKYLDDLWETANIKVYGMYEDLDTDTGERILYVIGRTPDQPYKYFSRTCTGFGCEHMKWNGWQAIDLDISDDHVMPFVQDKNFYIAWPTLIEKNSSSVPSSSDQLWEIKLNWAQYSNKGWIRKKMTRKAMPFDTWTPVKCQSAINDRNKEIILRLGADGGTPGRTVINVYNVKYYPNNTVSNLPVGAKSTDPGASGVPCVIQNPGGNGAADFTVTLYDLYRVPCGEGSFSKKWVPASRRYVTLTCYYTIPGFNPGLAASMKTTYDFSKKILMSIRTDDNGTCSGSLPGSFFDKHTEAITVTTSGVYAQSQTLIMEVTPIIQSISVEVGNGSGFMKYYAAVQPITKNTKWTVKDLVSETQLNPRCEVNPIGRFIITSYGDVEMEPGKMVSDPLPYISNGGPDFYANGYLEVTSGAVQSLLVVPGPNVLVVPEITSQGEQRLFIRSPYSSAVLNAVTTQEHLQSEDVWHYSDQVNNVYIQRFGVTGSPKPMFLGIRDRVITTAGLRADGYSNFDVLYSMEKQKLLQEQNFFAELSNRWGKISALDPSGFCLQAPSAIYNWEILYHAPMLAAESLTRQQRFSDAHQWLNFILNPTKATPVSAAVDAPVSPWQFLPFREEQEALQSQFEALVKLAQNPDEKFIDTKAIRTLNAQIMNWLSNPFSPYAVARYRWNSFQWRTVFAYLDNLIGWGDNMFRRFTRESVYESIQYYHLALKLLGPRPTCGRAPQGSPALSYREIYGQWYDFSTAWFTLTDAVSGEVQQTAPYSDERSFALTSLGMAYFCIPHNDKLIEYWDTVEDRLFKIRYCMDIEGVVRELPLFAPSIDPELLVRATAAGLDLDTVLADLEAPLLPYRFNAVLQKANEMCTELKSLGTALLSALEKKDSEELARLRSTQEIDLLKSTLDIERQQVEEARANIEVLAQSKSTAQAKLAQYQRLLGKPEPTLDQNGLPVLTDKSSLQVAVNAGEGAGLGLIQHEVDQIYSLDTAQEYQQAAGIASTLAGVLHAIPESATGSVVQYLHIGGTHFGNAANAVASVLNILASNAAHEASMKGMFGQYVRRQDEWVYQSRLVLEEMKQIEKQSVAAEIRLAITEKELENHRKQIENAQQLDEFMHGKFTNQELYSWMVGQISAIYFSSYRLACDLARKAEKAFQVELGVEKSNFISYASWDSLKKGLLAGENLSMDLKRLEIAYLQKNTREFEITKHVSLLQLNPLALIQLKKTGTCEIMLPEALFDIDFPGHYFRRIKSVSLTMPCVVGPYTCVNCKLTLLSNTVRVKPLLLNGSKYGRSDSGDDPRFKDYRVPVQSIAISHGQNDSGMFELNFRDERYLPFEGAGVISGWRIELPNEFRQFDYNTVSDVIIHLKYTAREGGDLLGSKATGELMSGLKEASDKGFVRLFSIRHEFPTEWARFIGPSLLEGDRANLSLKLRQEHFPFWAKELIDKIQEIEVLVSGCKNDLIVYKNKDNDTGKTTLEQDLSLGEIWRRKLGADYVPIIVNNQDDWPVTVDMYFDNNQIDELWLAVTWSDK